MQHFKENYKHEITENDLNQIMPGFFYKDDFGKLELDSIFSNKNLIETGEKVLFIFI
jgi:hypothetical protein